MVQLSDLHAIIAAMPRLDRHGYQPHPFDLEPITDSDFPAFELAVDFLSPFWSGALAQLNQPIGGNGGNSGMTSLMLADRAERFATLCGQSASVSNGLMIAAMAHSAVPLSIYPSSGAVLSSATVISLITGPAVLAALNGHRDAIEIMTRSPEPLDDEEAKMLAVLALHGIDAPDGQIKRVFLATRPSQMACIYQRPGSRWLHFRSLLPIGRAKKLGLEYLL